MYIFLLSKLSPTHSKTKLSLSQQKPIFYCNLYRSEIAAKLGEVGIGGTTPKVGVFIEINFYGFIKYRRSIMSSALIISCWAR